MASITLQVVIGDLSNGDLDSYEKAFSDFLTKKFDLPGSIDDVEEVDREEDEPPEDED